MGRGTRDKKGAAGSAVTLRGTVAAPPIVPAAPVPARVVTTEPLNPWQPGDRPHPGSRGELRDTVWEAPTQMRVGLFDRSTFAEGGVVRNEDQFHAKPTGGLWTSDYDPEYGSPWLRHWPDRDAHGSEGILIKPLEDVHVLQLRTREDMEWLRDNYLLDEQPVDIDEEMGWEPSPHKVPNLHLDWERLSREYDGLHVVSPWNYRSTLGGTFDIPSTVWFNAECFETEGDDAPSVVDITPFTRRDHSDDLPDRDDE